MEILEKDINQDTLMIHIKGEVASNEEVDHLRKVMTTHEQKNTIIHLANVSFLCSIAIAMLVMGFKQSDGRKGSFILCQPSEDFLQLLKDLGLFEIFTITQTEQEAIEYLQKKKNKIVGKNFS